MKAKKPNKIQLVTFIATLLPGFAFATDSNLVSDYEEETTPQTANKSFFDKPFKDFSRKNQPVYPDDSLQERSCAELDEEISYLIPDTYQYKADFTDDAYNGAAIWGSAITPLTIAYLPYSWAVGYQQDGRRHDTFYRIEKLRRAKQMKHCFEARY